MSAVRARTPADSARAGSRVLWRAITVGLLTGRATPAAAATGG
ncbi:MAG: hypothetical protein ACR2KJ_17815 [Jatrophihabitans sp.]